MAFIDQHWDALLFFVFWAHLFPFAWLAWRHRSARYVRVSLIFVLLIIHRGLLWARIDTDWNGLDWAWLLRGAALALLVYSIFDWWRRRRVRSGA